MLIALLNINIEHSFILDIPQYIVYIYIYIYKYTVYSNYFFRPDQKSIAKLKVKQASFGFDNSNINL